MDGQPSKPNLIPRYDQSAELQSWLQNTKQMGIKARHLSGQTRIQISVCVIRYV